MDVEATAVFDQFDDLSGQLRWQCRTAPASSQSPISLDKILADVWCAVNHDGALPGMVVDSRFQPVQAQRIPMLAEVRFTRGIEAQA